MLARGALRSAVEIFLGLPPACLLSSSTQAWWGNRLLLHYHSSFLTLVLDETVWRRMGQAGFTVGGVAGNDVDNEISV